MTEGLTKVSQTESLPSYRRPPVSEVYAGVRFQAPDKLNITHFGLLWNKFRSEYPTVQHSVPIESKPAQLLVDQATGLPLPRVWFINTQGNQLVQFQVDRFYFNWRSRGDNYPRYPYVIEKFQDVSDTIRSFFSEFELGELKPVGYELNYTNHIPLEDEWQTVDDFSNVFRDFTWVKHTDRFLPRPEGIAWNTSFRLPKENGILSVKLNQATRQEDKVRIIVFELTVRGNVDLLGDTSERQFFDTAHEWIVRGFTDLTTHEMQTRKWERESA
jgi:uncharacterized protein (TIGR04255 family)